jgi:hypothetical protein
VGHDDGRENQASQAMKDAEIEAEIEDFLEGCIQPTYRGMRIDGVRLPVSGPWLHSGVDEGPNDAP